MATAPAFKTSFAQILRDLQKNGSDNLTALAAVGALASALARQLKTSVWSQAKQRMSEADHTTVLRQLETQGVALLKAGNHDAAYAAQVIAASMIARRYRADPEMQAGETLLDQLIDHTAAVHNRLTKAN